jgi:hypothetical protein
MKTLKVQLFVGVTIWASVSCMFCNAQADSKPLKARQEWRGRVKDADWRKVVPNLHKSKETTVGYIVDAKAWEKVWKAWRGKADLPKVDFEKELVLVATTRGDGTTMEPALNDKGDLTVAVSSAAGGGGGGFSYHIMTIKRDGVKAVEGKPLPSR